ncbi:MAG TPA: FAD/NAD(P)-binding oxidoreductase [Ruminococcaceae bacterium]|nr:FAD/NAD(P)-binding oxidoreductase [Oscillospiraceae bacterium]
MIKTDVLIIGAGAVGCALARELSKYDINVTVCDKNDDVGGDASKSNSGLFSTSATMPVGTLECKLRTIAHSMMMNICKDLDVPVIECGSIAPILYPDQLETAKGLTEKAFLNGVYDYEILPAKDILEMEPTLNPEILGGIYSPRDKQANQFILVSAMAENAAENGVEFILDCKVTGIDVSDSKIQCVHTTKEDIKANWVINAAGLFCDDISKMVDECDFAVHPRKGEFYVFSHDTPVKVSHIISSVPSPKTRGVLVIPTVDNNMLVGPTADDVEDKTDKKTTSEGLASIKAQALKMVPGLHFEDTITQFVGVRPARIPEGYDIRFSEKVKGFIGISGVRSTGLTASVGIAGYVVHGMKEAGLELNRKVGWKRTRKGIIRFADKTNQEKDALIKNDPLYGKIVCRCEQVTESEILQAIHRPVGAKTLDAVKRRVRAGMGRCQSGFCSPIVIEIIARELGIPEEDVRKRGEKAFMLDKQ